jgi:23S rRNA (cytosine1962-C5)-methyltransferase
MATRHPPPRTGQARRTDARDNRGATSAPGSRPRSAPRSTDPRDSRFKAQEAGAAQASAATRAPAVVRGSRPREPHPVDRRSPGARESHRALPDVGPDGLPNVVINRRGTERWQEGHPWIYRADLATEPSLAGGEVVRVLDARGWFLGKAFYSKVSKIALRCLTLEDEPVDRAFFLRRIAQADALRRRIESDQTTYRAVHADADLLPGLVVDRFGDVLSAQFLVKATDDHRELLADVLVEHFGARGVMDRSDVGVRALEGLASRREVLRGEVPETVPYTEGGITLLADVRSGQKTGAFLDQRENHLLAATYGTGQALDCFAYHGGFALQLARGAAHVTAVEISGPACVTLRENATRNGLTNVEAVEANAFDFLRDAVDEGRRFDTIVLDPPSFAKNKDALDAALRGYKEINLRALQLLNPGGILMTGSCTYHVDEERFEAMLASASADAKRRVQIVERRGAPRDHPVLVHLRETRYLKFYVLRVLG